MIDNPSRNWRCAMRNAIAGMLCMAGLLAAIPARAEVFFDNTSRPQFIRQVAITNELAEGVASS